MRLIEGIERVVADIVGLVIVSNHPSANHYGLGLVTRRGCSPWPHSPASATPQRRSTDEYGTLYGPTSLGLDGSAAIEDACPMTHSVADTGTYITIGDTNTNLNLLMTDHALLHLTRVAHQASREMLGARHQPVPDWLGYEVL
jgi:hypothetical protein